MTLFVLISALMSYRPTNMIAQSQSGTGKTAAFVLTMLTRVDISQQFPQVCSIWLSRNIHLSQAKGTMPHPIARTRTSNYGSYYSNVPLH